MATILLELIVIFLYFDLLPNWLVIVSTLGAAQLASYGSLICLLPITGIVLKEGTITNKSLQKTSDAGSLIGIIIGGIVYPIFKLFPPAVLLALAPFWLSKYNPQAPTKQSSENTNATQSAPPINHWCLLQGLCIGALFGLLPLWVISIKRGSALEFSIVFGAFMLGRIFTNKVLPKLSGVTHYFLCAVLIFLAFLPQMPLWVDVFIFIPLGASITSIEFELIDHLKQHGELSFRRDILFRSLAIASAISSLIMGGIGQAIGVTPAMLLVSLLFSFAALVTWRWRRPTISLSTN